MASEIRVNKIENRSGLGTVTFADTGVDLAGIVTATTFSGSGASLTNLPAANVTGTLPAISGANLTNLPAANLTGDLPAISGANLTGIAATDNVRTGILDVAGVSTFRNTMNVGAAVTISESGIEASGIGITVANINGGAVGGRRNLVINGDMNVAQRGTSSTTSGYGSVDRFGVNSTGVDEAPTHAQVDVASGTTPYSLGFRKALKVTNGNQTGGTGATDFISIRYKFEAQDIANSGWNYTSSSSFVTLSFWCKSSVAQNFYGYFYSHDGTAQNYAFETGSLTADTWTKVVLKIPGNSNLQFDNNNDAGLDMYISQFWGTDRTDPGKSLNSWAAYNGAARTRDFTSTWYTTDNATFELTGVQFEVGSQATAFEHRSFQQEYLECARYYLQMTRLPVMSNRVSGYVSCTSRINPVPMRAIPSLSIAGTISFNSFFLGGSAPTSTTAPGLQNNGDAGSPYDSDYFIVNFSGFSSSNFQTNEFGEVYGTTIKLDAEL